MVSCLGRLGLHDVQSVTAPYYEASARVLPAPSPVLVKAKALLRTPDAPVSSHHAPAEAIILGLLGGSAAGDYGTTLKGLQEGYKEGNPLMRPFAEKGALPLGLAEAGLTALTGLASHKLKEQGSKLWWIPPMLGALGHGFAIRQNLKTMR